MSKVARTQFTLTAEIEADNGLKRTVTHAFDLSVPDEYSCTDTEEAFIHKSNAFVGNLVRELSATVIRSGSGAMEGYSDARVAGESPD